VRVSAIVPALNEAMTIERTLKSLQAIRSEGGEIIVVDGGSEDETSKLAAAWADKVIRSSKGRARQMNAGAAVASGDLLFFVHADTLFSQTLTNDLIDRVSVKQSWGFFPVILSGQHWLFRVIERMMNWRSRLTSVATGDQAIFVSRALWQELGGYADIPLMEDIEFSKRLRKRAAPQVMPRPITTSSRRWEEYGIAKTIVLMWRLRWKYYRGIDPRELKREYS